MKRNWLGALFMLLFCVQFVLLLDFIYQRNLRWIAVSGLFTMIQLCAVIKQRDHFEARNKS